jgi:hypothetical protein
MIVFSRNVVACRCGTDVPDHDPDASPLARALVVAEGREEDLDRLDREHHDRPLVDEMRGRLRRGDRLVTGRLGDRLVHYFWLSTRAEQTYPSLPGCTFTLDADTGYGYDAWTHPSMRGAGIRRRTFLDELRILRGLGMRYEASFFVAYQLEGAIRSLGRAGVVVEPVWRIRLAESRSLVFEPLLARDETMRPSPAARGRIVPRAARIIPGGAVCRGGDRPGEACHGEDRLAAACRGGCPGGDPARAAGIAATMDRGPTR